MLFKRRKPLVVKEVLFAASCSSEKELTKNQLLTYFAEAAE